MLVVISIAANAQSSQKYNSYLNRTEFFNSNGQMIGYAKENTYLNRIEYYDANGTLIKYEKQNNYLNLIL